MNLFDKLLQIADALEREKVEYILIGGFAVILYGLPRLTQDLDLFINNTTDNVQRLRTALNQVFQDQSIEEITVKELDRYPVIRYGSPDGFTPLESPAACSGDEPRKTYGLLRGEDKFLLKRTRGLMPRVSRPVRRAKLF